MKIPFGDIDYKTINAAEKLIRGALDRKHLTEGPLVAEFEKRFAEKFQWKHAIPTSSGTTAGEVVWAAVREIVGAPRSGEEDRDVRETTAITPACAFVATASCLLAAGIMPEFVDVGLSTLNMDAREYRDCWKYKYQHILQESTCIGVQFVATMGSLVPLDAISNMAKGNDLPIVGDLCEAHGARLNGELPNKHLDAAIYSLYPAHMVVGVEGGVVCTDDDRIAELCRSIKSHGRPAGSNYFRFERVGFNAKWSDLHAAVALASLEGFDERFEKRRWVRGRLIEKLSKFEDEVILYRDADRETIAPHAFPVVLRDENKSVNDLYYRLECEGVEVKTLFGSLPTMHTAFSFLGHKIGEFPVAERIGRTGLHFSCAEYMDERHVAHIASCFDKYFSKS